MILDAGALIAFERGQPRIRALVRAATEEGATLVVPAGVLAQVWRDGARQARLSTLVGDEVTTVEPLDANSAMAAGVLCGRSGTSDVVDASVVVTARLWDGAVVTDDVADLRRLDPGLTVHAL